jgi:hypothetical protein
MKLITSIQGSVIAKYSADDAASDQGTLSREVVEFIGSAYNFSLKPEVPPGLLVNPIFVFQSGKLSDDDGQFVIHQVTFAPGAIILTAKDTELATRLINKIIITLDEKYGSKIRQSIRTTQYMSVISVEFGPALEEQVRSFERAQAMLNREIRRPERPFALKRLSFGGGDVQQLFAQFSVDDIQNTDFTIERRQGEPYELNRYHCSAPISTPELVRIVGLFEEVMRT